MKPPECDYFRPADLPEALALLDTFGDEAKVLAGGQSLVPLLNLRLARPTVLIDIGALATMRYIRADDRSVTVGALTTHRELVQSAVLERSCPLLPEAARLIGHPQIRTRGTIGGSLAHADGSAELPTALTALGGQVRVSSVRGERVIGWAELFDGPFTTSLEPDEIITEVDVPSVTGESSGSAFVEFALRPGDFALVGCASVLHLAPDERCSAISVAFMGIGATPARAHSAEAALTGAELTDEQIGAAIDYFVAGTPMAADVHASADYRRDLARHLGRTAVSRARGRAKGRLP